MTQKQTRPGKPDPSRFAAGAEDFEPMRLVETTDGLAEEERGGERRKRRDAEAALSGAGQGLTPGKSVATVVLALLPAKKGALG